MKRTIRTDPQEVGEGAAEAARWVDDALTNARGWFPEMSESELRRPLEQAFELAREVGRGEREFHEVFEAELRRAVEERDVLGATGSVLPAESGGTPKAFPVVAEGGVEPSEGAEATPVEEEAEAAEPGRDDERARLFVLEVGALRFHDDLSPEEIQSELGVDADYYSQSMRWLLGQVDRGLDGDYPGHLDRGRMARFAAGLASIEDTFAVERHVRECRGCATYLADLLDATVRAVERDETDAPGPVEDKAATPRTTVSYTNDNAWIFFGRSRRRRHGKPAMSIKAAELRKYGQSPESAPIAKPEVLPEPSLPAERLERREPAERLERMEPAERLARMEPRAAPVEGEERMARRVSPVEEEPRTARRVSPVEEEPRTAPEAAPLEPEERMAPRAAAHRHPRPVPSRVRRGGPSRRQLVPVALVAAAAAVVVVVLAALSGGGDREATDRALASMKVGGMSAALVSQAEAREAAHRRAVRAARERAERRERHERAQRKARLERRAAQRQARTAPAPAPASVDPVAPAPASPSPQSAPPAVVQTPPPSAPSVSEFGPEP